MTGIGNNGGGASVTLGIKRNGFLKKQEQCTASGVYWIKGEASNSDRTGSQHCAVRVRDQGGTSLFVCFASTEAIPEYLFA